MCGPWVSVVLCAHQVEQPKGWEQEGLPDPLGNLMLPTPTILGSTGLEIPIPQRHTLSPGDREGAPLN